MTYTSTESLSTSNIASDTYTVTIKGSSAASELTLLSAVRETYTFNIPTASTPMTMNPVDSTGMTTPMNTIKWTGCPITCTLQKLNTSTNVWSTFTPTTEIAFVTSSTDVCKLTIDFTTASTFWTSAAAPNLNQ